MNILVGYDRSNVAKEALALAKKYAKAFDAKIFLLTAMAQGPDLQLEDIQRAENELDRVGSSFKEDDIPCETHAVVSALTAGEVLVQFEQENDIDEIVIGVRRRSKVGKLLFGSNAQYIILMARCPVVAVK